MPSIRAALTQDRWLAAPGEIDDVLDGEEVAREVELPDQRQLALQGLLDAVRKAQRIAPRRTLAPDILICSKL